MGGRFVVGTWRRSPSLSDSLPIDVPDETFDLERIGGVLATMPRSSVLFRDGAADPAAPMPAIRNTDFSDCLERRLATEAVHINMVNVHAHDPLIADVLRRFVDLLQTTLPERPALCRPTAALFLSSPGACTHYHVDREQNFLLHIRGKKTVHVFAGRDTLAVEMVKACSRKGRRIHGRYRPDLEREARLFQMVPETTLYIPRLWPHWVDNGDEISVSLSLNCFTASDMRRERVYTAHEWVADLAARVARRARLGRPGAPD